MTETQPMAIARPALYAATMATGPDPAVMGIIVAIASAIVAVGWFIAVGFVWAFIRRVVQKVEGQHGDLAAPENVALLLYALSAFFWPAGFVLGAMQLKDPKTTRQARNCLALGLAHISVIVVLTCAGMTIAGFMAPAWFSVLVS